jgi:UDP-N-acetylmuramoyl-L-alanyl-D-glutamate--2,6-diaminopimelate ligase
MSLDDLLALVPHSSVTGPTAVALTGAACDSRRIERGSLFGALKGFKEDGRRYAADALARGAAAVLSHAGAPEGWPASVPWVVCPRDREAFSAACAALYSTVDSHVAVAGVTGTNGKTTVAYLLRSMFRAAGGSGMLGTVEYDDGVGLRPAARTTPEADEVHRWIRTLADTGVSYGAMEVSSHSLVLCRVRHVAFRAACFTNLTRDHLDFHQTMEAYYQAKRSLFDLLSPDGTAVVNIDDPYGMRLAQELEGKRLLRVGGAAPAQLYPREVTLDLSGIRGVLTTPWGDVVLRSPLVGRFNLQNLLVAVGTALAAGAPAEAVAAGAASLGGVPGRLEPVNGGQPFSLFVDYAHTDDAIKNLLATLRSLGGARLITVFGCGGDRDRSKRPLMGAVAARQSDVVILTSDNPRTEDPEAIADDVEKGLVPEIRPEKKFLRVLDRREAIRAAIAEAREGDVVVIAGKGHERMQSSGGLESAFHDPTVARAVLEEFGWRR